MTIFEFNEQLCEIIAGEDGYYNYDKQEILELAKQMKTSAEEYENLQQQLNYSQAVRRARPEWDDDKVRRAAEYLVLYMDVRLKPYKVNEKLNEFDKDGGFLF